MPKSFNTQLTPVDIEFIGKLYPKQQDERIVTMKGILAITDYYGNSKNFKFTITNNEDIIIDWGDDKAETLTSGSLKDIEHEYSAIGAYEIKLHGDIISI